ncbi:MAG: hypothetical protein R3305_05645 [Gammaproteobacteria bacterium]|nr:hypothetical protein [Gammaproteobacteria bacterium]
MKHLICLATLVMLTGCSSGTTIRVSDPDARIFVNGEYVGTGRGHYTDRKPSFTRQEVTIRKEGCAEQSHSFRRNERPDLGAIVGAYYLVLPIMWMTQYKRQHAYEYDCEQIASN